MATINVFCLPFAGGNKYSYREFEEKAPSSLKLIPLDYPGRGSRMGEGLVTDMRVLVEDLYNQVKDRIAEGEYAIYGHSMGALAALLLVRKIVAAGKKQPRHLFVTGTTGPSAYFRRQKIRHRLSKSDFIQEIKDLDGSPEEILSNEELLDYFEPILRADFQAAETYEYVEFEKLDVPLTVITGTEEDMEPGDIYAWQEETNCPVDFRRMQGKHFFIFLNAADLMQIIAQKLLHPHKILES